MDGRWTIYKRESDGTQGEMIPDYTELSVTWNWGKLSKFQIEGRSVGEIPLGAGDSVIFYRNESFFLGGVISKFEIECPSPESGLKNWKASGEDDTVLFSHRIVFGDPMDITFESTMSDKCEDFAYNRLIHYINNSCYKGTVYERWLSDVISLPEPEEKGTFGVSAYHSRTLDGVLDDIGKEDELFPVIIRDPRTGLVSVSIPEPRDMTDQIMISPKYGNVVKWKRKDSAPEFNAVWVIGGEYSEGRLYVYAEDVESIKAFGRIEQTITKSDVKPWEKEEEEDPFPEGNGEDSDDEEEEGSGGEGENPGGEEEGSGGEEEGSDEEDEDPDEEEEDPDEEEEEEIVRLNPADVLEILRAEARTQLSEHGVKHTYTIIAAEMRGLAFWDDWKVGDRVSCMIDGEEFESMIRQAKINVKKGQEEVEPTIGDTERGLFGEILEMIEGLDDRLTTAENSE
jgi:hypothetical protein